MVEGDVINTGSLYGNDAFIFTKSSIFLKSLKERFGNSENYYEKITSQALLHLQDTLTLVAMGQIKLEGAKTYSKKLTSLYALSGILDIPVPLLSQEVHRWSHDDEDGVTTTQRIAQHVSEHSGDGAFRSFSAGGTNLYAPKFAFKEKAQFKDTKNFKLEEVHNTTSVHSIKHEDGGWFSGDTTTESWSSESRSIGASFKQ